MPTGGRVTFRRLMTISSYSGAKIRFFLIQPKILLIMNGLHIQVIFILSKLTMQLRNLPIK
jgi:hypothetical protein